MADDIRRWSDELAREPASLVFLQLGEALRRQGQLEIAFKIALRGLERHPRQAEAHDLVARIAVDRRDFDRACEEWETVLRIAPDHVGAMKGLGYVCFQQGRFDDAERYLTGAAAGGAGSAVNAALQTVRRSSGSVVTSAFDVLPQVDPPWLFADLLLDDGQTALLLDVNGYVLAGIYQDDQGNDLAQEIGAQLSGISDEVDIEVNGSEIIIRSLRSPREGWEDSFRRMAAKGDDRLLDEESLPTLSSWDEEEWQW